MSVNITVESKKESKGPEPSKLLRTSTEPAPEKFRPLLREVYGFAALSVRPDGTC
ncbi:MAG: hypothetical protein ABR981_05200 [Candidatus Micrarchaeaceae archaeon]|jgi:hypothetical protein